ncbi:unnamed protein product [Pedinophyceae sp. YPF-701]|nr:unnamed protein product [Pedinophyceae sp. YPF-701]
MDAATVAAYEARAAEAEKRLTAVEAALAAGQGKAQGIDGPTTLSALSAIRGALVQAQQEQAELKGQLDAAVREKDFALKEVEKANYRIKHLVRSLREADEKLAAAGR